MRVAGLVAYCCHVNLEMTTLCESYVLIND